jgi:serine/threonine protein kinase
MLDFIPPFNTPHERCFFAMSNYGLGLYSISYGTFAKQHHKYSTLWECAHHLVSAVEFLHLHGVAHLDIKPHNMVLGLRKALPTDPIPPYSVFSEERPHLTLLDLGSAEINLDRNSRLDWACDTPNCMPPDVMAFYPPGALPQLRNPPELSDESWLAPYHIPTKEAQRAAFEAFDKTGIPPYDPFAVDVWCAGNVISIMSGLCRDESHRNALISLGSKIKQQRPNFDVTVSAQSELRTLILKRETSLPPVSWVFKCNKMQSKAMKCI